MIAGEWESGIGEGESAGERERGLSHTRSGGEAGMTSSLPPLQTGTTSPTRERSEGRDDCLKSRRELLREAEGRPSLAPQGSDVLKRNFRQSLGWVAQTPTSLTSRRKLISGVDDASLSGLKSEVEERQVRMRQAQSAGPSFFSSGDDISKGYWIASKRARGKVGAAKSNRGVEERRRKDEESSASKDSRSCLEEKTRLYSQLLEGKAEDTQSLVNFSRKDAEGAHHHRQYRPPQEHKKRRADEREEEITAKGKMSAKIAALREKKRKLNVSQGGEADRA